VGDAFACGFSVEEVHQLTKIDPWFLVQIKELIDIELALDKCTLSDLDTESLRDLKRKGFSDRRLAYLLDTTEGEVRKLRHSLNIRPVYKRVDTCAAEFSTQPMKKSVSPTPRITRR
jgi:carbamoyl-phosphate synthase large subunit